MRTQGPVGRNPGALSQAGTLLQPNSPKRGLRAGVGRVSPFQQPQSSRAVTLWRRRSATSRLGREALLSAGKPGFFCATSRLGREAPLSGAWQSGKTAGQKLAILSCSPKPGPCSSKTLPSEDVVQDKGEFLPPTAVFLPSRDFVAAPLRNVPALERGAPFSRETGRFLRNVPARERSAPFRSLAARQNRRSEARHSQLLSQAGTLFQPNSPEQGRRARPGRVSPFQSPRSSRAGTLFQQSSPKRGRCARLGGALISGHCRPPKPRRSAARTFPSRDDVPP